MNPHNNRYIWTYVVSDGTLQFTQIVFPNVVPPPFWLLYPLFFEGQKENKEWTNLPHKHTEAF
jgi:hypothetical protein